MERAVVQTDVDRYIIVEYIAEGGMGAIFLGKKIGMEGFEKEVVLKQLLPEFTSQPEFIELFLREARLSASLDHANIVHTIDLVTAGTDYFIVMEYVRGGDLRSILRRVKQRGHRLDPAAGIFIAREVLGALAYAHEKLSPDGTALKLIHRDVSPSNVMVSAAGEVKLTDFGIAKASTHKSVFYRVKGKVGYMSPEQAMGEPLDHRSDLYSVAICLHEMLTGERLFIADLLTTPQQIYSQPIPRLEDIPGIPPGLDAVMDRALARRPADRYQTALELQDALVKVAFESAMLFTAPDLASHLRAVCGEDVSRWSRELEEEDEEGGDRPSTELLAEDRSQFSGVALTSIFTLPPEGVPREADHFDPEATRQVRYNPQALAYASTRLMRAPDSAPWPAFDLSDLSEPRATPAPGERAMEANPWPTIPSESSAPGFTDTADSWPAAPGALDTADSWPAVRAEEDEREDPTLTLRDSAPGYQPDIADLQEDLIVAPEWEGAEDETLLQQKAEGAAVGRIVGASAQVERPGTLLDEVRRVRPEPHHLTARVQPRPKQGGEQRHRTAMVIVSLLLLVSGGAIALLVGLTGPTLDEPRSDGAVLTEDQRSVASAAADAATGPDHPGLAEALEMGAPGPGKGGVLRVLSAPDGAAVFLDGVHQCQTSCTVEELELNRLYLLSVRQKNYVSWSTLIDLRGRKSLTVRTFLTEEPDAQKVGFLLIRATPPAEVLLDGKEIGRVTSEGRIPLPPGQYEVTLTNPRRTKRPRFLVTIYPQQTVYLWRKF